MAKTPNENGVLEYEFDIESLTCVCGNNTGLDGFMQTDAAGNPLHLALNSTLLPGAVLPQDGQYHSTCHICGRIYSDETAEKENKAPVIGRLAKEDLRAKQDLYWDLNGFNG